MREVAVEAFKDESRAALMEFYHRIETAQTREDLVRAWRSIPRFTEIPNYLAEKIFSRFRSLEDRFIVAGIRAALRELLKL